MKYLKTFENVFDHLPESHTDREYQDALEKEFDDFHIVQWIRSANKITFAFERQPDEEFDKGQIVFNLDDLTYLGELDELKGLNFAWNIQGDIDSKMLNKLEDPEKAADLFRVLVNHLLEEE